MFSREPAIWMAVVRALYAAATFGLKLSPEQMLALIGVAETVTTLITRQSVTPNAAAVVPALQRVDALEPFDPFPPPPPAPRKKAPSVPPGAAAMLCLVLSMLVMPGLVVGCSSAQTPQAQAAEARTVARAGYAAARMALFAMKEIHSAWMNSKVGNATATQAEVDASNRVLAAFEASKKALEAVRPWLSEGEAGSEQKEKLLEALDMAFVAVLALESLGNKVPDEVTDSLQAARALIGGPS